MTGKPEDAVEIGTKAGEELKEKIGSDSAAFFGDFEVHHMLCFRSSCALNYRPDGGHDLSTFCTLCSQVAPEPKSSITGAKSDGLGGYEAAGYTIGESEGKIGGELIVD